MTMTTMIPVSIIVAIIASIYLVMYVFRQDRGNEKMQEIAAAIREGAMAFLSRQYKTIAILSIIVAALLGWATKEIHTTIAFIAGAFCSGLSGYIGMYTAVNSNIRAAAGASHSLNRSLTLAFRGGAVTGLAVTALSLLGVAVLFYAFGGTTNPEKAPLLIVGFGFGASFVALFAQLGGGIYTKAADVGADLVGKVEAGIPEDDPRNPAVIADLVGDNVGDCAGRGADLFESTAAENIGAMILGIALIPFFGVKGILFPLVARAFGIIASIIGMFFVKTHEDKDPMVALSWGYVVATILSAIFLYFVTKSMLSAPGVNFMYFYGCVLIGLVLSFLFVIVTNYYTSINHRPVKEIAKSCVTGPATNIITGLSVGMESTAFPVVMISLAIMGSYLLGAQSGLPNGGLYGTAVATMAC